MLFWGEWRGVFKTTSELGKQEAVETRFTLLNLLNTETFCSSRQHHILGNGTILFQPNTFSKFIPVLISEYYLLLFRKDTIFMKIE